MNRVDAHTALRAAPPFAEPVAVAPGRLPVAVIGGGFSGTMVAIHLGAWLPEDRPILLCERGRPCRGAAYGTPNPGHMLNVRANNMSAFPHQPDHFDRWLDAVRASRPTEVLDTAAGRFASRGNTRTIAIIPASSCCGMWQ